MNSHARVVIGLVAGISIIMIFIVGFHAGGPNVLKVGLYSQLVGAFIGGALVLLSVNFFSRTGAHGASWGRRERLAWTCVGLGCIFWGLGECYWRYMSAQGQNPFPSFADLGYSAFPPFVFIGLLLQPFPGTSRRHVLILLDSLIAMGALFAIAWFLLLGPLAQAPGEATLATILGLYYPTTDIALLSCLIFLLLRGQGRLYRTPAHRISLLILGIGLSVFAISDFFFNILQNAGTYVDGTWIDLGWPLGIMAIGVAAYLRLSLPSAFPLDLFGFRRYTSLAGGRQEQMSFRDPFEGTETNSLAGNTRTNNVDVTQSIVAQTRFGLTQALPYLLVGLLFSVQVLNILSTNRVQQSIRPVLLMVTIFVVCLVIVRQIITMIENEQLVKGQAETLAQLEKVYQDIAQKNTELETGISHLKEIQAQLSNGNLRARAYITDGNLWPLAVGLNRMADRMKRYEYAQVEAQSITQALADLALAIDHQSPTIPFTLPASCPDLPAIHQLVRIINKKVYSR